MPTKHKVKKRKSPKFSTERFIAELEKRGELSSTHRQDFNLLLDDVAPPVPVKKK